MDTWWYGLRETAKDVDWDMDYYKFLPGYWRTMRD